MTFILLSILNVVLPGTDTLFTCGFENGEGLQGFCNMARSTFDPVDREVLHDFQRSNSITASGEAGTGPNEAKCK